MDVAVTSFGWVLSEQKLKAAGSRDPVPPTTGTGFFHLCPLRDSPAPRHLPKLPPPPVHTNTGVSSDLWRALKNGIFHLKALFTHQGHGEPFPQHLRGKQLQRTLQGDPRL